MPSRIESVELIFAALLTVVGAVTGLLLLLVGPSLLKTLPFVGQYLDFTGKGSKNPFILIRWRRRILYSVLDVNSNEGQRRWLQVRYPCTHISKLECKYYRTSAS
jgi:hypothetical protein